MTLFVHHHIPPYTRYGLYGEVANLTSNRLTFEYIFTASGFSGTAGDGRLRMGFSWRTGTFQIDDVSITPLIQATATNTPPAQATATNTPLPQATATNTPPQQATATVTPTNTPVSGGCGVPAGNLVTNGDFAAGTTNWSFYSNGSASFSPVSGPCGQAAQVAIGATGSNIQLYQPNISLQAGAQYVLRFDAKSDNGQDMEIYLHKHVSPYNSCGLFSEVANLTSNWQTFEYIFTASGFSGTTGDGRLRLWFSWRTGTFQLDDISLTPVGVAAASEGPDGEGRAYLSAVVDGRSAQEGAAGEGVQLPDDFLVTQAASADVNSANSGCMGRTASGSTNWQSYSSNGIYLDVDTSHCGFSGTPVYITSLGGSSRHWNTTGATSLYAATENGFRVYVRFADGSGITPQQANSWNWHIEWMALPAGSEASGRCSGQTVLGNTAWQQYGTSIYVDVVTSGCGFGATPIYATSLGGSSVHWITTGTTSIYQASQNGFRVYVRRSDGVALTTAQANGWNWHINWTGSAASTSTPGLCAGKTGTGNTNWQTYDSASIYLDVDTSGCGNQATPVYATSLGGSDAHYLALGMTSIYQPTPDGFRVYVRRSDGAGLTPAQANGWNWHLNWTAVPETTVTKYYYFGAQRVAMQKGNEFRYLHGDHLGSTVMETNLSGAVITDQKYYAFGSQRDSGPVSTDHKFTGQKLDGSGLMYYNARYYDPAIGQFVSPDTLVPDPENVLAYNRYMYTLGNPLNLVDPSGHCATNSNGDRDWNDGICWRLADSIANMWDDTDYWQNRFGDVSVWNDQMAPSGVTTGFLANELDMFFNSDAGRNWSEATIIPHRPPLDLGDYWRASASFDFAEASLTRDDFGNVYLGLGFGLHTPSFSVERGDVLINTTGHSNPSYQNLVDIDSLDARQDEKAEMMKAALVGESKGGSVVTAIGLGFAATEGQESPYHATHGPVFGIPGASYSSWSRSWMIWEAR